MTWHDLVGTHVVDFKSSHWRHGEFVGSCAKCGREMVKLPGLNWRVR